MAGDDKNQEDRKEMRIVEEGVKTLYSGTYNISVGPDEVIFAFGNRSLDPSVMRIESKIAVSLKTAKRMAITLGDLIRRYEAQNGFIEITSRKSASGQRIKDDKSSSSDDELMKTH
jgi:hypothetical protein